MLTSQKSQFQIPDEVTYLNGAYMSPQLKSVEKAGVESIQQKNRPFEIAPADFFTNREELKKKFASLVSAPDNQNIAIIPSVSYGIANVAQNVRLKRGEEIIIVDEQFPSNVYSWQKVAKKYKARITMVKPPKERASRGKFWNQYVLEAINTKTAVVAMPHVHWTDGTLFDLKKIRAKTREVGAMLIIDGTQSVGALPFSIQEIQPDALICGGYKWLMGPYSLGVAYFSDTFNDGNPIEENWINRLDSEDFSRLVTFQEKYRPKAERYSVGESSNFILVPMLTRAIEQLIEWGPSNIQEYCSIISRDAIERLRSNGYFIEDATYRAEHLFGIYLPAQTSPDVIRKKLIQKKVFVSYRGDAIRVSPNVYNTKEDFNKLLSCF